MEIIKTKKVYTVDSCTDLAEGRGGSYILAVCELKSTAVRMGKGKYVQGSDCPIIESTAYLIKFEHGQRWVHAFNLQPPKGSDITDQQTIEADEALIAKALDLGLTKDEILKLTRGTV